MIKKRAILAILVLILLLPHTTKAGSEYIASWYGGTEKLNKHTANGEIFNPSLLTCASWDYPFGTRLKVTNLANGQNVTVRVNDRGPNKRLGRTIDLTRNAFSEIANTDEGLVLVKIEKVR